MASATHLPLENLTREYLRIECFEIGCLLTDPDEFHGDVQRFVHGEHDPTFGRLVDQRATRMKSARRVNDDYVLAAVDSRVDSVESDGSGIGARSAAHEVGA